MAATKTGNNSFVTSQSSAAASAVNAITATLDCSTAYGATITAKATNGTAPGVGVTIEVDISADNTNWKLFAQVVAPTTASTAFPFTFVIPPSVLFARIGFGGNTTNAVTVEAQSHLLTGI